MIDELDLHFETDDPEYKQHLVRIVPGGERHTPGPSQEVIEQLHRLAAEHGMTFTYEP